MNIIPYSEERVLLLIPWTRFCGQSYKSVGTSVMCKKCIKLCETLSRPLDSSTSPLLFWYPPFFGFYLCGLRKWGNRKEHWRQGKDLVFCLGRRRGSSSREMTLDSSFPSRFPFLLSHYRSFISLTYSNSFIYILSSILPL